MSTTPISFEEFKVLRDLIREKFGINYDDTKQFLLQSRLQTRLIKRSVETLLAYHRFLLTHPEREAEFAELAPVLSNNETYFFRERAQLDVLAKEVVDARYRNGGGILTPPAIERRRHLKVFPRQKGAREVPFDCVAIGTSTGDPVALSHIIPRVPRRIFRRRSSSCSICRLDSRARFRTGSTRKAHLTYTRHKMG